MKKLFFILTINVFSFLHFNLANAVDCSTLNSIPTIELTSSYGQLEYNNSLNNLQITNLASRYGIIEKGLFASGLATVNVNWEINVNTIAKVHGDYDICVIPTSLNVFIGFSKPTVYISQDLVKNSCEYNVVLRHEQTHQQINKVILDYFLPQFQSALEQIAATVKPEHIALLSDIDAATTKLTTKYNQKLSPLIEVFKFELLNKQSKLDNHLNYEYEQNLCRPK